MKNLILKTASLLALMVSGLTMAQITTTAEGTYLIGDYIQLGIDKHCHEGTHEEPGVTTYARTTYWGADAKIGFVAMPEEDIPWGSGGMDYDGCFFTPGSPENGFGITYAGVNYHNNCTFTGAATGSITSTLAGTGTIDDCMNATYDLDVGGTGITMEVSYDLKQSDLYYTTEVTITNTTAAPMYDIYYGRNVDPDNNVSAMGTYTTTNTVVAQPSASCDKAVVTAESNMPASNPSFMGFGAIGPNFRVGHGGFNNDNAEDMWTGTMTTGWGAFMTTEGDVNTADQAIFLSYRVDELLPGASETFKFVVILAETQLESALADLYTFDSPSLITSAGECTPEEDTVETCPNVPVELSFDGPTVIDYDWTWSPPTDLSTTTGLTTMASPSSTTTYTITGVPVNPCYTENIERTIVVDMLPGPIIDITNPGLQCDDFLLSDLVITDVSGLGGTIITEFYIVEPDSIDDPDDLWPTGVIAPYEEPIVMMGNLDNGCFATDTIKLDWGGVSKAGRDSTESLCNVAGTIIDISTYRSPDAELGGTWEEFSGIASPPGAFDAATGVFDVSGIPAGLYEFYYIAAGTGVCPDDTAVFAITVSQEVIAGADNASTLCNSVGNTVDINTLLSGHDAGGFFEETTFSGSFTPATGIIDVSGLAGADYSIDYIVLGAAPCPNDTATFTITVNENPVISAGIDQTLCEEASVTSVAGAGAGGGGTYVWDGGVTDVTSFTPPVGVTVYTVVGTDVNGCSGTDNMTITVNPTPIIDITPDTTIGCTDFRVLFTSSSTPESSDCVWTFGDGNTADDCGTVMNVYEYSGDYTVGLSVTSIHGCVNSISYADMIHVETQPIAAFQFTPNKVIVGETGVEFTNNSLDADAYEWNFGDGSGTTSEENPSHEFPNDIGGTSYDVQLVASNSIGCADTVTQQIIVEDVILFYIPNSFTPDGDEFNETFAPVFTEGIDVYDFHMVIYNRWGEIIFESYNPSFQWDGTYGNQGLVEEGVYIWQFDFKETMSDKRHKHNGHVTVLK